MQYLYDENGKRYLDLFAGIVTVSCGHAHPKVLAAIREQMEKLQEKLPSSQVVKAFNTVFAQHMSTGSVEGEPLSALIASDDDDAKAAVMKLASDIGFDPVDAGPLVNARHLEPLGYLNIQLGYVLGMGTQIGFRVVHS